MSIYRKGTIALLLSAVLAWICLSGRNAGTWNVLISDIPGRILLDGSNSTMIYVIKQTHRPLFKKEDGQNYTSDILRSWSRDLNSRKYVFCPDDSLMFDRGRRFDLAYFENYIREVTGKYSRDFVQAAAGGCVTVEFSAPRRGYLDYLCLYSNSPSVPGGASYEVGLGPFELVSHAADQITLERKAPVRNGYNRIVVSAYKGAKDPRLARNNATDYNNLSVVDKPVWLDQVYTGFENLELRSANIVINHEDPKVRRFLYNCIDIRKFRAAFMPKREEFSDLATVLPMGVPGARPGLPAQDCRGYDGKLKDPIVLLNHRDDNEAQLEGFVRDFSAKTKVRLVVKKVSASDLVAALNSPRHPYNLVVINVDTMNADYKYFFKDFTEEKGFLNGFDPGLGALYRRMLNEDNPEIKTSLAVEIAEGLGKSGYLLPLYQNTRKLYYPPEIRNLKVGRGFLEYPEVAEFRW